MKLSIPQIDALADAFPLGLRRFRRGWAMAQSGPFHNALTVGAVVRAGLMRERRRGGRHEAVLTDTGFERVAATIPTGGAS